MSPLPNRPTPADLTVVPSPDLVEAHVTYVHLLAVGADVHGRPLPRGVRVDVALDALAHGAVVQARIAAAMPDLVAAALDAGAAPADVAAALGLPPMAATVAATVLGTGGAR